MFAFRITNGTRWASNKHQKSSIKLSWHGEPGNTGLYYYMVDWLGFVKQYYPWLNYKTRQEAIEVMYNYDKTQTGTKTDGNILDLETNVVPSYFALYLRESNKILNYTGCKIIYNYECEVGEHYIIKATDSSMQIKFKGNI